MTKPDNTSTSQPTHRGELKNIIILGHLKNGFPCGRIDFIA
jgi:hypothetical protein